MTYETGITVQEKAASLFQPDVLLPAQYFETLRRKTLEPEEKLMLAVLEDAVACFLKYLRAENRTGKTLFRDAEEWIWEENSDQLFSFENICEALELSPTYVRRGLLRCTERKPFYYHKVSAIESLSPRGKIPRTGNGRIKKDGDARGSSGGEGNPAHVSGAAMGNFGVPSSAVEFSPPRHRPS